MSRRYFLGGLVALLGLIVLALKIRGPLTTDSRFQGERFRRRLADLDRGPSEPAIFLRKPLPFEEVTALVAHRLPADRREYWLEAVTKLSALPITVMNDERVPSRKTGLLVPGRFLHSDLAERVRGARVIWGSGGPLSVVELTGAMEKAIDVVAFLRFEPEPGGGTEALQERVMEQLFLLEQVPIPASAPSTLNSALVTARGLLADESPAPFRKLVKEGGPRALFRELYQTRGWDRAIDYWMTVLASARAVTAKASRN